MSSVKDTTIVAFIQARMTEIGKILFFVVIGMIVFSSIGPIRAWWKRRGEKKAAAVKNTRLA
jgi:hypothetical protein